jgi:hypothetical protein
MVNGRSGFKCVRTPREVGDGGVNGNPLCNTHWRGTNERSEEDVCREGELKIGYRKNGRSERICISGPCLPKAVAHLRGSDRLRIPLTTTLPTVGSPSSRSEVCQLPTFGTDQSIIDVHLLDHSALVPEMALPAPNAQKPLMHIAQILGVCARRFCSSFGRVGDG